MGRRVSLGVTCSRIIPQCPRPSPEQLLRQLQLLALGFTCPTPWASRLMQVHLMASCQAVLQIDGFPMPKAHRILESILASVRGCISQGSRNRKSLVHLTKPQTLRCGQLGLTHNAMRGPVDRGI